MTRVTMTLLLAGIAALSLTACSDSKGPGALGSKNDIVVRNNGIPGQQQAAAAPDAAFSSTVENVEANPPAEVAAGEPVPAPAGAASQEPLPSTDPAVEAAAQKVAEAQAPVPSTTSTPVTDGTPASTAPATDTVPADVVAPEPVNDQQAVTPPPLEGTATAEEKAAGAPVTRTSSVYPAEDYPAATANSSAQVPSTTPVDTAASAVPAPEAAAPVAPALTPASSAPAEATPGTKGTAYEMGLTGKSAPAESAPATTTTTEQAAATTAPASGTLNPYDPAMIKAAQTALKSKVGYSGATDGQLSSEFLNAVSKYQSENKLTPGGLNAETLRHLGIIE